MLWLFQYISKGFLPFFPNTYIFYYCACYLYFFCNICLTSWDLFEDYKAVNIQNSLLNVHTNWFQFQVLWLQMKEETFNLIFNLMFSLRGEIRLKILNKFKKKSAKAKLTVKNKQVVKVPYLKWFNCPLRKFDPEPTFIRSHIITVFWKTHHLGVIFPQVTLVKHIKFLLFKPM